VMGVLQFGVLGLLLLCGSNAIRNRDPSSIKGLVGESVTICGDDDIWDDISSPGDVNAIKGINWKDIDDIMEDFIGDHKTLLAATETKIATLKKQIAEKKGKSTARDMSLPEIERLVEGAVADQTSFGSKDAAIVTACGKPGKLFENKRPSPEWYDNGVSAVQQLAAIFFDEKLEAEDFVEADKLQFTKACEDTLGFERTGDDKKDDMASYCDEMCAEMAQAVQVVSNQKSPAKKYDVKKLERELAKAEAKREQDATKQEECESAQTRIGSYRAYLQGLLDEMSSKHKLFQNAEWALANARDVLDDLTDNMAAQKLLVDQANQGLSELGQIEQKTKDVMETAKASLEDAKASLDKGTDEWKSLVGDLEALRAAEKFADEVKQRLSLLLLKMDGYVEECVREPVRNIGLSEETHVYDGGFFKKDVSESLGKEPMEEALSAFHKYCEGTAKGIFELVKDKVDLSPLCDLPPEAETSTEITAAVQERKDATVEAIQSVQSWLDPFKGTDVTKDTETPDYVDKGEPLGLRRVMTLPSSPNSFYSNYLKKWKKNGEFLELLAQISVVITGLDEKVTQAADAMERMAKETEIAQSNMEVAVASFHKAAQDAQLEKTQLTDILEDLKLQIEKANQNLEDLKKRREEAKQAWISARDTLERMHAEATASLVQSRATLS